MKQIKTKSGIKGYQCRLRENYNDFGEFEAYSDTFGLAEKLGFKTAYEAWQVNPVIQGSTNPEDFCVASPAIPSPLPETETGVSIDTPTEAREVFEYLDGPDGNFESEPAPEGWETDTPPTPGNEREGEGFTPGQWEVRGNKIFAGKGYNCICTVSIQKAWDNQMKPVVDFESEANARLIASAPDMYRFIKEMANRYSNSEWIAGEANKLINSITGGK